jgi:protocatechuate 3,4-dioxygenase beta subunit
MFAQAGQPPQAPRASGLLAGRVVDAAGEPVGGAVVVLRADSPGPPVPRPATTGQPVPVRTDGEGRFVFTDVPGGKYWIEASKGGWLPGALGRRRPGGSGLGVDLGEAEHRNDLRITVWRPGVIAGTVTDDNGDPLVGVEVRAVQLLHIAGRRQMVVPQRPQTLPRQKTDDRGAYRFSDLVPGDYVVAVLTSVLSEPPEFAGTIRAAGATPNTYYQTMTGLGTAPIVFDRATGVAAGGRGLVDSLSSVSGVPTTENAWLAYPTTYYPSAVTQTAATIVRAISGEPKTSIDVHVRMVPTWQVSGVLTAPDGPAPWHAVHLVPADTGDQPLVDVATAVTDAQGAFTFYGVPTGQYIARVVRIPAPGPGMRMSLAGGTGAIPYVTTFGGGPSTGPPAMSSEPLMHVSVDVTVTDRHVRNLALALAEGPRVRGRAVFEGASPAPTSDQWRLSNVGAAAASGREDSPGFPNPFAIDGQFTTPSLWPGKYLLRVTPPRGWFLLRATYQGRDISATPVEITSDIENVVITFTDRARTLKGTVQGDDGSKADATVVVFPVEPEAWVDYGRTGRRVMSARVTETGTFSLPAPADGEYYVMAIPEADTADWQNPATLAKLAPAAERVRIQGDGPPSLSLRLRRMP